MKQAKITISMSEEDMQKIKKFCKDNGINLSAKTVKLWLEEIER